MRNPLTSSLQGVILGVPSVPVLLFSSLRASGNSAVTRIAGTDGQGGTGPDLFFPPRAATHRILRRAADAENQSSKSTRRRVRQGV